MMTLGNVGVGLILGPKVKVKVTGAGQWINTTGKTLRHRCRADWIMQNPNACLVLGIAAHPTRQGDRGPLPAHT